MTTLLDAALAYAARGWPVFPCAPGSKVPAIAGSRGVLDATTDPSQIRAWWASMPTANIGIATGAPGPDVLDVDVKPDGDGWPALARIAAAGLTSLAGDLTQTPGGGLHAYFTGTAQRNGRIPGQHLDFRGTGGYVLAPPSAVGGRPYQRLDHAAPIGGPVDWLAIRALLDPPPDPATFQQPSTDRDTNHVTLNRPGDDWATQTSWDDILAPHSWRKIRDLGGGRACWCRPGKQGHFTSATTRDDGGLYVFSTSTEFDPEVPYSKFGAYTVLQHGGDHAAAARRLRAEGYGEQASPAPAAPLLAAPGRHEAPGGAFPAVDLRKYLRHGVPEPKLLPGRLLYAGGVHVIAGDPDCGKTTLSLWLALTALRSGQRVMMLDEEGGAETIAEKLIALGATEDDAERFTYIEFPGRTWAPADIAELHALTASTEPAMVLFDSCAGFMARAGLDENSATDVTAWWSGVLLPLARQYAAAVTVIDHDSKNGGGESRYSRGSGAKLAASDVMIKVDMVRPFSRAMNGKLKLAVTKDRRGHLHRFWDVVVKTSGGIQMSLAETDMTPRKQDGLTPADEKLLAALTTEPMTQRALVDRVAAEHGFGLRRPTASESLNRLLALGLADRIDQGNGRQALWSLAEAV